MNTPLINLALFTLALSFGAAMLIEGVLIGLLHRQMIPLPSKVLYWIGAGLIGKEKSTRRFAGNHTPENLRTYAIIVLFFGTCLIVSSFIYLNASLAAVSG